MQVTVRSILQDRATATRPGTENHEPLIDMDETPRRVIMRLGML